MSKNNSPPSAAPRRQLNLLDTTSIIVGIIIGSTIYESTPLIASSVPHLPGLVGVWILGGILSLVGALCYAELANAYPKEGGDYVYLTRAFGRRLGFVFAWAQLWVVRPGSIGAFAFVFARYAQALYPLPVPQPLLTYAVGSIVLLTVVNIVGLREGKWTQNLLSILKYIGLLAVVAVAFLSEPAEAAAATPTVGSWNLGLAMIFIFFAYSGWNEMAYVGSEVRDPEKNILRALLLGTVAVTVIYVLLNLAFVYALGLDGMRKSEAVASDVLRLGLGDIGGKLISLLICITALGGINGMIFTGARIYYAMGTEHRLFAWLGRWNAERGTPLPSLIIQSVVTLALVLGFSLFGDQDGFKKMVIFTGPIFWGFFLFVGLSLFVLRVRQPDLPRPYRVPGYPIVPLIFCCSSAFMLYSAVDYSIANKSGEALWAIGLVGLGVLASLYDPPPRDV